MATAKTNKTEDKAAAPEPEENKELSPLEEEIASLPEVDDDLVAQILKRMAGDLVSITEYDATIRDNTLDKNGIANFAETHEGDEELSALRKDYFSRLEDIDKLQEQINALEEANKETEENLHKRAEALMSENIDPNARIAAKSAKEVVTKRITQQMTSIKTAFMPEWQENQDLSEWFANTNRRVHGGQAVRSAGMSTNKRTRSKEENDAIREWAMNNGIKVAEKGRIAESVIAQYEAAH